MIAIVGGGLAGLSAAFHLKKDYQLFESSSSAGGIASSFTSGGFTFDHAIHILYTNDPYVSALIRKLLGSNFEEHRRSSWIFSNEKYTPYPYQTNMRGLPLRVITKNLLGLIAAQFHRQKPEDSVRFDQWVLSRFGRGIASHFMLPLNEKIWAIPPDKMNCEWMKDRVQNPDLYTICKGVLRSDSTYGSNAVFWYPSKGGISALPNALQAQLPPIRLRMHCTAIDPKAKSIRFSNDEVHPYSTAIISIPLPVLVSLLLDPPKEVIAAASRLKWNTVTTVNLGIERSDLCEKHWIYVPEKKYLFQRLSFPSNFSSSLVPPGMSSIMAEISSSVWRPLPPIDIVGTTIQQLQEMKLLQADDKIVIKEVRTIEPAYIIYDEYRCEAVETIHRYLRSISIIPCGRFGDWAYLNMDQTILSGKRAAEEAEKL